MNYLMNTSNMLLNIQKNSTQTILQGGRRWATLIFNSMFVVGVLYCAHLFFEAHPNIFSRGFFPKSFSPFLFSFPLLKLFSFYFLSSILLDFSKCLIAQNIGCLIQTPLKNSTQTFFRGGSPWATLIFSSMFVVGVLYSVQLFLTKSCSPFLCYSFCLLLIVQFSWHPLLDFHCVSMGCLQKFYANST